MPGLNSPDGDGPSLIELRDLVVDFGANRALDRVTLSLGPGEIVGLVGANGAGKSTLGRVLVGEIPHGEFSGDYRLRGQEVRFANTWEAHEAGVALVHQESAAIDGLSIGENVMLTIEPVRHGAIDWPRLHEEADRALRQLGLSADTRSLVGEAPGVALAELVEVARSIARGSTVFVFDESTSALGADEIRILLSRMRDLAAGGAAIIFISHRLDEVLSVCNRLVVLRDGRLVSDGPRDSCDHASIVRAMLGASLAQYESGTESEGHHESAGERTDRQGPAFRLAEWRVQRSDLSRLDVGPLDFEVGHGEILGVFGPLGAGKSELLHSLYGLLAGSCTGECWIDGRRHSPFPDPVVAIGHGLGLVSADRQKDGVIPGLSVLENMMLGHHRRELTRYGLLRDHGKARHLCERFIDRLGIRTSGPDQPIEGLSGGNQQKVLIARALLNSPRVLLLDEPTRGIDVGAKQDVYELIHAASNEGTAIIVTSLEENELIELARRILVLRDGRPIALLDSATTSEHDLVTLAAGGNVH